jgi:hypothetical protein
MLIKAVPQIPQNNGLFQLSIDGFIFFGQFGLLLNIFQLHLHELSIEQFLDDLDSFPVVYLEVKKLLLDFRDADRCAPQLHR